MSQLRRSNVKNRNVTNSHKQHDNEERHTKKRNVTNSHKQHEEEHRHAKGKYIHGKPMEGGVANFLLSCRAKLISKNVSKSGVA